MKIKTDFWKQRREVQVEKIINILFWTNAILITNLIFYIWNSYWLMSVLNGLLIMLLTIIQISYNRSKENGKEE